MKKQLLSIFAALTTISAVLAQPASTWSISQNSSFPKPSTGVKFMDAVDPNVLWLMGYDGTAGNTQRSYSWFSRSINGGNSFNTGVVFQGTNTVIGDTSNYVPANMEGIDANTAWVCAFQKSAPYSPSNQGGGVLYRTTNGGTSWTNMTAAGMFTDVAQSFADFVTFLTPNVGITVGDPVSGSYEIWRTTNGGLSWTPIPAASIPPPASATEFAITNLYAKQGTSNIWFGTNEGRMYYTSNQGLTWSVSNVGPSSSTVTEIAFTTPMNGVCYLSNGGNFELYNTSNGGATWTQVTPLPANVGQNDVIAVPGTNSLVSTDNGAALISWSTDNGVTWNDYGSVGVPYLTADFADANSGWAGAFNDATNPAIGGVWKFTGASTSGSVAPSANFSLASDLCISGPSATVSPQNSSTGSPTLTYAWSVSPAGGALSSATVSSPVITFTAGGTYTVTLLVTNSTGTNSSSQVITVAACSAPSASYTYQANNCNNISFTTTATSSGVPAPSYSWSAQPSTGVTFSPSAVALNPSIKGPAGTYTLTLEATNNLGTSTSTQVMTISNCAPNITFTAPSAICVDDGTVNIVATNSTSNNPIAGANSYTWSVIATTASFVANKSNQTHPVTYSFTVKNTTKDYTITLVAKNASGTNTVSKVILHDACTGLAEQNSTLDGVSVYPNPAHEQLTVSLPAASETELTIVNVLGSVVHREKISKNAKETTLKLVDKPKGVYFLTIQSGTEKVTKKIIIE